MAMWTRDQFDRPALVRNEYRAVSVGGRPQERESLLIDGRPFRPIIHMTLGRRIGSRSLFAHEQRAGVSQLPDDECWSALRGTAVIDPAERMRHDVIDGQEACGCVDVLGEEHWFYPIQDAKSRTGLEWIIRLPREPDGLVFPVEATLGPGISWYYQGELTPEELAEGAERPPEFVDSWAIYASRSGSWRRLDGTPIVDCGSGKLGHELRPSIEDRYGHRQWCTWKVRGGLPVGIVIPAGLAYPATLYPSYFGYGEGGSASGASGTLFRYTLATYSPAANGTLDAIEFFTTTAAQNFRLGLYESDGDRVDYTAEGTSVEDDWTSIDVIGGAAVLSATSYQLAHWVKTALGYKYDAGTAKEQRETLAYSEGDPFPNPYPSAGSPGNTLTSIRAAYTESGGGPTPWLYAHRRSARIVA